MMRLNMAKILYTALKPTGKLTLGNYIGVLKNLKALTEQYDHSYICVADLHAMTINVPPKELNENIYDIFATFLALGFDRNKVTLYVQSQVPEHAELGWVLNNFTQFGEASRMTQYKDHVAKGKEVNVGIFDYPVLMAADILLYDTNIVPVGHDQVQHVEIARDIAIRFNNKVGQTFVIPDYLMNKTGAKVMGLTEPTKKMSKSDDGDTGTIFLHDDDTTIVNKIKKAVTDSDGIIAFDPVKKPGVSNLLVIYSKMKNITIEDTLAHFKDKNYGFLKQEVASSIVQELSQFKAKYMEYRNNEKDLRQEMFKGYIEAHNVASAKLKQVYKKLGLVDCNE